MPYAEIYFFFLDVKTITTIMTMDTGNPRQLQRIAAMFSLFLGSPFLAGGNHLLSVRFSMRLCNIYIIYKYCIYNI